MYQDEFGQTTESRGFCTSDHSVYYYSVLAVLDLGALVYALYETYLARNLSTEFAESAYIAKALVVIVAVSLLGIPIAIIASEDPKSRFLALTGIIFAICMSLLLFIFVPKELYRRKPNSSTTMHIIGANMGIKRSSNSGLDHSGLHVVDTRLINKDLMKKVEVLETKIRVLEESQKQEQNQKSCSAEEDKGEVPESVDQNQDASQEQKQEQNQKSCSTEEDNGEVPASVDQNQDASQDRPSGNGTNMVPMIESCNTEEGKKEGPE
jgi:7 transmembrane sweet-taste receptor of 3 GCPR